MNRLNLNRKETILLVLSILFFISLLLYSYYLLFEPAREQLQQSQDNMQAERQVLSTLQQQATPDEDREPASSLPLQRKVPVEPVEETILLRLGEAETVSGTEIENVAFTTGEMVIENPPEGVENVQELLTTVTILSADYEGIATFIEEVERMDRITVMDSISFAGPPEKVDEAQEEEPISLEATFSSFYRPDLESLREAVPKVPAPPASQQEDPFPFEDDTEQGAGQ